MKQDKLYRKYSTEHVREHGVDWSLVKRLLKYLRPHYGWVIVSVLFLMLAKVIEASVPIFVGLTAQKIIEASQASPETKAALFDQVWWICVLLIGALAANTVFDLLSLYIKNWSAQKALFKMRVEVFDHIQRLPVSYYDHSFIGKLMTRTIHDIDQISQLFVESVIPIFGALILFILILVGISWADWRITLVFLMIVPFLGWLTYRFQYYQRYGYDLVRNVISSMNTFIQEHLMGSAVIRNFGLQKEEKKQFDQINNDYCTANLRLIHHFAYFVAGIEFLQNCALIAAFIILAFGTPLGAEFPVGVFFTFSIYTMMFFRPLADLAERYNVLQSAVAASERIFHVLDEPTEYFNQQGVELESIQKIEFKDVWFAYEQENWVFQGLSFTILPGHSVAIVGVTGAGKTTVINLLLRFYEFQKGQILINDKNILEYSLHSLRRQFSVVLQDPVIFSGTISENISLNDPKITFEQVEQAVKYVQLDSTLKRLKDGLDHKVHEHGLGLSVGEMQLISLARAVAHHRPMLILDEATANIDTITEHLIQQTLDKLLKNQTALVIAHRLSTLRNVSRIIVISDGRVSESGTHEELLEQKGLYEKLFRLQFL